MAAERNVSLVPSLKLSTWFHAVYVPSDAEGLNLTGTGY